ASESMPGPKWQIILPPTRPSTSVGTNHDEIPGPVAIASQTCSGVPGTSTSTWMDLRPVGSIFTLITMMAPYSKVFVAAGGRRSPGDVRGGPAQLGGDNDQGGRRQRLAGRRKTRRV